MINKILTISILFLTSNLCAADLWTSLSVRDSYYGKKFDFEIKFGGQGKNTSWMWGFERENDEYFKMSDAQYIYEEFRWQWYKKEAVAIDFSEALWATRIKLFKFGEVISGGSLRNDMVIDSTVYLGYVKYKWDALSVEYYYDAKDYYSLDVNYKKHITTGIYFIAVYKDINGNLYRQAKFTYEFYFKKEKKK